MQETRIGATHCLPRSRREGLMMRALAMRLFHLGCDAHVVGDMTLPPVGKGDLLLVSAGPGHIVSVANLAGIAGRPEPR